MVAIDGMGGHGGGDRAAAKAREAMQKAAEDGKTPQEIMEAGHRAIVADNTAQGIGGDTKPGAVAIVVETSPVGDGTYRANFAQVGDADALVIRPGAPNPVIHHTSRPNALSALTAQSGGKPLNLLDDGRLQRGQTLDLRLDRFSHIVDTHLGGPLKVDSSSPDVPLQKGDIVLAGSDGFFENFGRLDIIANIVQRSGARTPAQVRDVLMQEALIRQSLLAKVSGRAINADDYARAYRQVTGGQEPPTGWRGMYEPWTDNQGRWHTYVLEGNGTVREDVYQNGRVAGSVKVDHFKSDNVTLMVQVLN
jgi:serine/threonine protein phosphatase PrpC